MGKGTRLRISWWIGLCVPQERTWRQKEALWYSECQFHTLLHSSTSSTGARGKKNVKRRTAG